MEDRATGPRDPAADAIPEGFGLSADGSLIPNADRVQGPSDIKTQYGSDTIPEQDVEQIERNRTAGLDAKGSPIPGATLSPAAQQSVAYEASLHSVETPVPVVTMIPATASSPESPSVQVAVVTHSSAAPEHVSWLRAEIERISAEFHRLFQFA